MNASMTGSTIALPRYVPGFNSSFVDGSSFSLDSTGANFLLKNLSNWCKYVQSKTTVNIAVNDDSLMQAGTKAIDLRTISDHMHNVKSVIAPSMSELAKDLNVTRQALYKWLSGESQPDVQANVDYIVELSKMADRLNEAGVKNAKALVKMKVFDGLSVMDIVKQGKKWERSVEFLIAEHQLMREAAKKAKLGTSKASPSEDWKSGISIPGSGVIE
ncbi:helix-turn-helix domain-containing protein [Atlantibacter hermannii]|uniref:helix-turn-helix domain-containing protein n=1 Tax=Atlantibacter hermannii TaxID=565 RepID=UPI002898C220|nr:helix-turn-helix transcriptional regulator [Atlantibacter hermannii]